MKSFRVLALSILAFMMFVMLAACGGGSKPPTPPPALSVTTSFVPTATGCVAYNLFLQGTGGTGTYTWSISQGALPAGLTLNPSLGEITGKPTTLGVYSFTAEVTDGAGNTATANLSMTVEGVMNITCTSCAPGTLLLPAGNPGVPYSATLTATGGKMPYTWCVIETSGACDNGSQGALPLGLTISTDSSGEGIISGTPTTPGVPAQFTVQVSDSETIVSRATAPLTLTIFDIGPKTLPNGSLNTPYAQNIVAIGGIPPYTFTLTGSLPPGLSFGTCVKSQRATCAITGAPTQVGNSQFSITVSDGENPAASASANYSITVNPAVTNSNLSGNYAFSFWGYNNGSPVIMGGAFVADGNGNITGGELDLNNGSGEPIVNCAQSVGSGPQQQTITTGSVYSIDPIGTGTLTLVTNSATYNFHIAIRADGSGSLIQDNTDPNTRGSGIIKVQTPGVTLAEIEGSFAVGILGSDPTDNRYSAAGQYSLTNPNGDLSPITLDLNDGGTVSQVVFHGTLSTTLDTFGRGCFVDLSSNGQVYTYTYYIITGNELLIVSTDPVGGSNSAPLTLWSTTRQIAGIGFSNTVLSGSTVIQMSGRDTNGAADVLAGLFVGQGVSGHTCQSNQYDPATFNFDQNQGGTVSQQQSMQGTYCVDANTGRVSLTGFNGEWQNTPPIFYVAGSDPGFIVGTDTAVSSGNLTKQIGGAFTNASLTGLYAGGTYSPTIPTAVDSVAVLFANGAGQITGTQFTSAPGGPGGPTNLTLAYSVDSTGRVVVQQSGTDYAFFYVVSATQFVMVPAGTDPVVSFFGNAPN